MSRKALVQLASRALALNLVIWAVGGLAYIPSPFFSLLHHRAIEGRTAYQDYLYTSDFIAVMSRLVLSTGLFIAAVWFYRCGPKIETFLSPSEE